MSNSSASSVASGGEESSSIIEQLSTSNGTTSNTNGEASKSNGSNSSSSDEKDRFVERESKHVFYLRLLVLLVLLLAAAAVSLVVFFITKKSEEARFETDYDAAAHKILETFMGIAYDKMGAAASLVVAMVAEGQSSNQNWPFITQTSFQERAATIRKLSGALYVGFAPVVTRENRAAWEAYSNGEAGHWYHEALQYQEKLGLDNLDDRRQVETDDPELNLTSGIANHIYDYARTNQSKAIISPDADFYLPIWLVSPVTKRTMINQNRASNSYGAIRSMELVEIRLEQMEYSTPGYGDDANPVTAEIAWFLSYANKKRTKYEGDIFTTVFLPVYDKFVERSQRHSVGIMRMVIHWATYFQDILPESAQGITVVLGNSCNEAYTYQINGANVELIGHGDQHDTNYNDLEYTASLEGIDSVEDGTAYGMGICNDTCPYSIHVYPSRDFVKNYETSIPLVITFAVACVFVFTVIMFFVYDYLVEKRQSVLLRKATQTHNIVSSLFPKQVRDQMLQENDASNKAAAANLMGGNSRLKNFLADGKEQIITQAPIADLYPNATVLFADIAGFTAWSSSREPAQVFVLLQSVYQAFDMIAKRRKVFKVETIGDSYVAVTGVPDRQPNHAIIMARFASECLFKMTEVTRHLETSLGPDTADLTMRFGLHSGPVTAGVLRGERSRFQLFGDTVNTASRMESTGVPRKIQCSQSTADLLINAGKAHWVTKREDNVIAKGKGVLTTFWLSPQSKRAASSAGSSETSDNKMETTTITTLNNNDANVPPDIRQGQECLKHERLIDWMLELFSGMIRTVVAKRVAMKTPSSPLPMPDQKKQMDATIALDELVEAITLPDFDAAAAFVDAHAVTIPDHIVEALRKYIAIIASAYRDNPFHNFDHACHVTMSVNKFLKRIVSPDIEFQGMDEMNNDEEKIATQIASHLHHYTHGINSDPITLFAIVFSALIHDVDHRGISNVQMMKEEPAMAVTFRSKSIAEQNSLELSWDLFMTEDYKELREYIFANQEELERFRQVIVNVVLATDIFDKELNELRRARWEKAFSENATKDNDALRATIVIEHIMQASDVCHTMQHWHIYRKWNRRLFIEMLKAYRAGRMAADPATFWYKGELGFFDNYIIPLSKKLKDCNVFGVSSDECLNYAIRNRAEWEARGEDIVAEMISEMNDDLL